MKPQMLLKRQRATRRSHIPRIRSLRDSVLFVPCVTCAGAMALREAWTRAAADRLPPKEQAKLWGLREALRKLDAKDTQYAWTASKVRVNGHGNRHLGRLNADTPVRFYYFMG